MNKKDKKLTLSQKWERDGIPGWAWYLHDMLICLSLATSVAAIIVALLMR